MKLLRRIVFCFGILVITHPCARAQNDSHPSSEDLGVMIQALEQTAPLPAAAQPRGGTYWSAQHPPGLPGAWPPFPGNIYSLDAWSLGDGIFLLNDTNVDYAELAAEYAAAHPASPVPMMRRTMLASSLSTAYAYSNPVLLTNMAATFATNGTITANFGIVGGTNFVPYDIITTTNLLTAAGSWNWLGIGYTSNNYTFCNQPSNSAFYRLSKPSKTMTVGLGSDAVGQCDVPYGLTNTLQVAGGAGHSLALLNNGKVVAWGWNNSGQATVPTNLAGVTMVAAGWYHSAALLTNGTVTTWGMSGPPYYQNNVPSDLTNATVISAQALHTLALTSNGMVKAWGYNSGSGEASVPAGISNVVAISTGFEFNLVVTTNGNGTVIAWGNDEEGQTNVPAGLSNVVDVAAGLYHSLALLQNGTVVAWGADDDGETDVPAGLTNVVAIAAGGDPYYTDYYAAYSMALKSDGTVVVWGSDNAAAPVAGLTDIISIAAGGDHALAVRTGPPTPVITLEPTDQYQVTNGTVTFSARGTGLYGVTYLWQTNGVNLAGATNATLTLTNVQAAQEIAYDVIITDNAGMGSIVSSHANLYRVTPPVINFATQPTNPTVFYQSNLTLYVSASAPGQTSGFPLSYQWQFDGNNITRATSSNFTFTATIGGTYMLIVSNAIGSVTNVWQVTVGGAPGGAWAWGESEYGQTTLPAGITNIAAIAVGEDHSLAVLDSGSVIEWGAYWTTAPTDLTNVVAVAAGYDQNLALRSDGTVAVWAETASLANIQTNLTGVKAVACGMDFNVALLTNGTVVAWGDDGEFGLTEVPAGLTNVTAISAQNFHTLALQSNGTVVSWGYDSAGETEVPAGLSNIVAVAAGGRHSLALLANGTVAAWGLNDSGQCNVPMGLSNVMAIAAGWAHSVALLNNGSVVSWGDNTYGQTNTSELSLVKLLAAGGNNTVAGIFSPAVMYPVDVTKDLLLIYNTNSVESTTVVNYYLQNRPMVGGANILGISCTTNETFLPAEYTNVFASQVQSWLGANPTKRPQYVILFYDIPSRVNTNNTSGVYPENISSDFNLGASPSVQYQLSTGCAVGWSPLVTSINMGSTNDCISYINKLAAFGANFSPGRLVISASAGGYGNINYCFDDAKDIGPLGYPALEGVTSNGVPLSDVLYVPQTSPVPLTQGTNVTGYLTGGANGALGSQRGWYSNYYTNVCFYGQSSWYLIETVESFNGQRYQGGQGNFIKWYSSVAFGGTYYSCTPVGAVTHVDEPGLGGIENSQIYFGLWAAGKNFAICAWNSRNTYYFQSVGDPFVVK